MIERQTIDGRPATVAYLTDEFEPAAKDDATFVRILYDDGESVTLSALDQEDDDTSDLDELEDLVAGVNLGTDEEYTANLGRNLEEARRFKHRPGVDAAGPTQKFLLIRHGKTPLNDPDPKKDRIRGWENIDLNDEGREEAEELGEQLADGDPDRPDVLVASDLSRASETADIISGIIDVPVVLVTPAFRPWNVGGFTGMESFEAVPVLIDHYMAKNPGEAIPGGESFCSFRDRMLKGMQECARLYPGLTIGIVAHYRNAQVLEGWKVAGYPADHNIDIETFGEQGEATGKCRAFDIPLDKLRGESREPGRP